MIIDEDILIEGIELLDIETPSTIKNETDTIVEHEPDVTETSPKGTPTSRSSGSDYSGDYEDIEVSINQFPVQVIALEACESTLDELMEDDLPAVELQSALMQIIMTLLVYEKVFDFTHNDLHTNNIMYVSTSKTHLCYHYKGIHYKVPTFGKIYKIIDFGRSIYRVNGQRFVSDSFDEEGDATTQYNIEPFLDSTMPVVEPNYSFDLCRLACSMYELIEDEHPLKSLVHDWCNDDEGNSVLYNEEGKERYPCFKLYTMISRTVTRHTPEAQLDRPEFKSYRTSKIKSCIDLDEFVSCQ